MEPLISLALVYIVFIGAMMSPGPDLLITMRNALGYSARAGVFTAAGIACALSVHMAYCIAGMGLVIAQSTLLFNLIKWVGAAYLIYIGFQALRSQGTDLSTKAVTLNLKATNKTDKQAFINGFVTNVFNPKATMFFLALFSQMLDPSLPFHITIAFGSVCMITAFIWFSIVSIVMGVNAVRDCYSRTSRWIDRVFGGFFVGLGLKLAFVKP